MSIIKRPGRPDPLLAEFLGKRVRVCARGRKPEFTGTVEDEPARGGPFVVVDDVDGSRWLRGYADLTLIEGGS